MTILLLNDYRRMFSTNIRAMLNWELLAAENATVETRIISTDEELSSLFTVWHVNSEGRFADWDDPAAHPLTVGESLDSKQHWNDARLNNVAKFQNDYVSSAEPVNLLLPVYAAGYRLVLLDSTHRAVAVHNGRLSFNAMLVILRGPVSDQVLPDLRWHANNLDSILTQ